MERKKFLKIPEYPGGKEAFKQYIADNLRYPEDAIKHNVQGIVFLSAEIDDNGKVLEVFVEKGIGHGCDEEAVRLVRELHFGGVTNRGIRLKTRKDFRIWFNLAEWNKKNRTSENISKAGVEIKYSLKDEKIVQPQINSDKSAEKAESSGSHYSYTISWKR